MTIEDNFVIVTDQWDYGTPVVFELVPDDPETSLIGDEIRLVFETEHIERRFRLIDSDDYTLSFALKKEEADALFSEKVTSWQLIPYSLKRYKDRQYLETLINSQLKVKGTVKW